MKPPTSDHRKAEPSKCVKPGGLPMVRTEGNTTESTCGWHFTHRRKKLREDRAEAHLAEKHGGRGLWL